MESKLLPRFERQAARRRKCHRDSRVRPQWTRRAVAADSNSRDELMPGVTNNRRAMRPGGGMRRSSLLIATLTCALIVPAALGFGFNDESQLPHKGLVGQPFSYQLGCRAGSTPYSFHKDSGDLPP